MKKFVTALLISSFLAGTAQAQMQQPPGNYGAPAAAVQQPSPMETGLASVQQQWAIIKYQMPDEEQQEKAIDKLAEGSAQLVAQFPNKAEPLIWEGIVLATRAGIKGGLGALSDAKAARRALEAAEAIDPRALNGSVYTSLGSLYHKVPGFPVGFGDDDKARNYLEKALLLNPGGIDPNFFYGEFLFDNGEYEQAEQVLQRALSAPARPGRELADKGRAEEIRELMAKIQKKKG